MKEKVGCVVEEEEEEEEKFGRGYLSSCCWLPTLNAGRTAGEGKGKAAEHDEVVAEPRCVKYMLVR